MNILFLAPESPYPPDHGHHLRSFNVLKCLANYNDIYFLGFAKKKSDLEYVKEIKKYCVTAKLLLVPQSKLKLLISLFMNIFSPLPITVQKYINKEAKIQIKNMLNEHKIDAVHVDLLHMGTYYKDVRHLPKIIENHNVESLRMQRWAKIEKNLFTKLYLYFQYIKFYRFEKKICSKFDRCTVVSDYDKELLMKMSPTANFVTIPNGVDIEFFKPQNKEPVEKNSLVWTGGLKDANNRNAVHYFLDEVFPIILSKIPDVSVNFIGKTLTPKVIKASEENQNIKAVGYVEDVRPYIEHAAVFIAPLKSGSGTKLKVLNALSLGKAVVTTSIGAEGIKVENNENIIIADDPREFADKTVYLLKNPEVTMKMGEKARKLVEEYYDWNIIGQKINQVYQEISQYTDEASSQPVGERVINTNAEKTLKVKTGAWGVERGV